MNDAIKLAIEKGGYDIDSLHYYGDGSNFDDWIKMDADKDYNGIILNPLFWQALGRAMAWDKQYRFRWVEITGILHGNRSLNSGKMLEWKYQSQKCFNLLLTGGDTEKFWKELLTK